MNTNSHVEMNDKNGETAGQTLIAAHTQTIREPYN